MQMSQTAPFPETLHDLVSNLTYRPGWLFRLYDLNRGQDSKGLTLDITTLTPNSYHPHTCDTCGSVVTDYRVHHYFIVPAAAYNRQSWQRWLFERVADVERHEACEFFEIAGEKPYAPNHSPGWDPYMTTDLSTAMDRRTSFRGEVNPV